MSIAVSNDADVDLAKRTLLDIIASDTRVRREPLPRVYSDDLSAEKTTLKFEYWAASGEWTETRHDLIDRLKSSLKDREIAIK